MGVVQNPPIINLYSILGSPSNLLLEKMDGWYTYLLVSDNKTYVGMTNNLQRRLRQHNCEIAGGAKYTHGHTWIRMCYVSGFPDKIGALRFEWRWKYFTRKHPSAPTSYDRRIAALSDTLEFYKDLMPGLEVIWEHVLETETTP
jgi:predicted GIY-YIG superfamily endonuclease